MPLDTRYFEYCQPGSCFYEAPPASEEHYFSVAPSLSESDWIQTVGDPWVSFLPRHVELPVQGWKIHCSATLENASRLLEIVSNYCLNNGIPFKFLRSREKLFASNSKIANRGSSGKFVTIYPLDDDQLRRVLEELGYLTDGLNGPYILSDLRWRNGPLYVRYGAFRWRTGEHKPDEAPPLVDPQGNATPDERRPGFHPPEWVKIPEFLTNERPDNGEASSMPYRATHALHFSNGGGVYVAEDPRSGQTVVLKEARPFAGLDDDGRDAVHRLRHEFNLLNRLSGLPCVPQVYEMFEISGHHFIAMEQIEGADLKLSMMQRSPVLKPLGRADDNTTDYSRWALMIADRIDRAVSRIHARGVVIGDVHPKNIVVRDDDPVFLDFEFSKADCPTWSSSQGVPGYLAPPDLAGIEADLWSVAILKLDLFLLQATICDHDVRKVEQLVEYAVSRFDLPESFRTGILRAVQPLKKIEVSRRAGRIKEDHQWKLARTPQVDALLSHDADWTLDDLAGSLTAGILSSATPHREDRLYPGDIAQFTSHERLSLGHGAAGVMLSLHASGTQVPDEHKRWLLDAIHSWEDVKPGLYDGVHGLAFALDTIGQPEIARDLLSRYPVPRVRDDSVDIWSGAAGIGLNCLYLSKRWYDDGLLEDALCLESQLAAELSQTDRDGVKPGYFYGWSGPALFWINLYRHTDNADYLSRAHQAIEADLARCTVTKNDTLEADEGWRVLPYLGTGGLGVGMAIGEYLHHEQDPDFLVADEQIFRSALYEQYGQPILTYGTAGMILYLIHRRSYAPSEELEHGITHHLEMLRYHAVSYKGHAAFRGDQQLRLSMDLATGSAGILLALTSLAQDKLLLPLIPVYTDSHILERR